MLLRDAQDQPMAIRREDYAAPAYWIGKVDLTFDLDPAKTLVLNQHAAATQSRRRRRSRCAWTAKTSTWPACWSTASACRSAWRTTSW